MLQKASRYILPHQVWENHRSDGSGRIEPGTEQELILRLTAHEDRHRDKPLVWFRTLGSPREEASRLTAAPDAAAVKAMRVEV